jgi:hypothetical protein
MRRQRPRRAAVTAEFALVLPVVVLLIALLLGLGSAVGTRVSCQDAVASGARTLLSTPSLLDGGQEGAARAVVLRLAPSGSTLALTRSGRVLRLGLSCPIHAGSVQILPATVTAEAAVEMPPKAGASVASWSHGRQDGPGLSPNPDPAVPGVLPSRGPSVPGLPADLSVTAWRQTGATMTLRQADRRA